MKFSPSSSIRTLCLVLAAAAAVWPRGAQAQSTYSWLDPVNGGTWSTSGNWNVTSGGGSTNPGAGDTAILGDVTSGTRIVTYDAGAIGSVGTLAMTQTDAGATNELLLQIPLTVTNDFSLSASAGTSLLYLLTSSSGSPTKLILGAGSGTLTVGVGGLLSLGQNGTTVSSSGSSIGGNVAITGGTVNDERSVVTGSTTVNSYLGGNVSLSAGTLVIGGTPQSGTAVSIDNRLDIGGNFATTGGAGGTIAIGSGLATGQSSLFLLGTTNDLSGLVSFDAKINTALSGNAAQTLTLGTASLGNVTLRAQTSGISTKTIASSGATIGSLGFLDQTSGGQVGLLLNSNLTLTATSNTLTAANFSIGANAKYVIDTGTSVYTLDVTAETGGLTLSNGATTAGYTTSWVVQGNGTIKATSFNLASATNVAVSGNVTLQATGTSGANNLGAASGSTATISPTSTFVYNSGSATGTATLTSNRTIGGLTVTGGSLLTLATGPLTVSGNVTLAAANDSLQLGGQALLLTGAASLAGNGLLTDSSGAATTVSWASGATGGLSPGVGAGAIGTFNLVNNGTSRITLDLTNSGTSTFDLAGTSSFDKVVLGKNGIVYGGTLNLNFEFTPVGTTTYQLFTGTGGTVSGAFADDAGVSSNLTGYDITFNPTSGLLTVALAVPEPPAAACLALGGAALLLVIRRRQVARS